MVYELSDELAKCPVEKLEELSVAIENLLIGYYEGNYILLISLPLIYYIKSNGLFKSKRAEIALHAIASDGGYIPDVLWRIKVVLDSADPQKHEVEYTFFSRSIAIQPVAFLCENLTDVKFYIKLSRIYYPDTPINAHYYHGGGGTTVDVLSLLIHKKLPCLVILDSDVKYPGCQLGDTAQRCISRYKNVVGYIELNVLDVHEAENLVPVAFMKKRSSKQGLSIINRMERRNIIDQLVYYDVKCGIRKSSVAADPQYKEYCSDLYSLLYNPKTNTFEKFYSQKHGEDDYLFSQIDKDLLEKFVEDKSVAYENDAMSPYREKVAKLVHTYVCCRGHDPLN